MTLRTSTDRRRLALATLFAGAATFSTSAFGDSAVAGAEPREWDIGAYDWCVSDELADYQSGRNTFQDYHENMRTCCEMTGGVWSPNQGGGCVAPPFEQAQEAERQPAPPGPLDSIATLYMPPPAGPAAPPPNEAVLLPAILAE